MKYLLSLLIAIMLIPNCADARRRHVRYHRHSASYSSKIVNNYTDSLLSYRRYLDNLNSLPDSMKQNNSSTYRLFIPPTFYHSVASRAFNIDSLGIAKPRNDAQEATDRVLLNLYMHRPDMIKIDESRVNQAGGIRSDVIDKPLHQEISLAPVAAPKEDKPTAAPVDIVVKKPNFWSFGGDYYLQFLQNGVSKNWYKGGEDYYSMVGSVTINADYNNKSKLKVTNKLEMKLGFQTSEADSVHKFKTNNDLIRYTGKLGYQASKSWYYTFQLLTYSQFTKGYKSNDKKVYSDFLAPYNLNLSLGMDYTVLTKNKKLKGTVNLAPFAYNFKYVSHVDLATRYGIDAGHHTLNDFGSEMTVDVTWTPASIFSWATRFYAYTTYKRAEVEWENTLTFTVNKFLAVKAFIFPRFDDGSTKDKDLGYWQFKEYTSFGFSYSF